MSSIPVEALIFLPRLLFCSSPPNIIAFLELIVLKKFGWEGRFEREAHRNQFAYCFVSFIILFPGPLQSNSRSHATCYDTLERKCRKAGLWIHGSLSKVSSHKNTVTFWWSLSIICYFVQLMESKKKEQKGDITGMNRIETKDAWRWRKFIRMTNYVRTWRTTYAATLWMNTNSIACVLCRLSFYSSAESFLYLSYYNCIRPNRLDGFTKFKSTNQFPSLIQVL